MFNNKAIIFFCLFFLSSCGTKKVSYRDNSPKKIENKSKKIKDNTRRNKIKRR